METIIKSKGILGIVAIFIILMFMYNLFLKPEFTSEVPEPPASSIGNELLKTREQLQEVTFDQTLFTSIGYLQLIDFGTDVPAQATGRLNPFNTIGRD